jgi:hypothetical protein
MNVAKLYQRLVATGILAAGKADTSHKQVEAIMSIKPVDFKQPETLKV